MENSEFKKHIDELSKMQDEKTQKHYTWIKYVLGFVSALLGLLISLHNKKAICANEKMAFITTIFSFSLGILSGLIFLFLEVKMISLTQSAHIQILKKRLDGTHKSIESTEVKQPLIFSIFWVIFVTSLIIGLISLVIYSIIIA